MFSIPSAAATFESESPSRVFEPPSLAPSAAALRDLMNQTRSRTRKPRKNTHWLYDSGVESPAAVPLISVPWFGGSTGTGPQRCGIVVLDGHGYVVGRVGGTD